MSEKASVDNDLKCLEECRLLEFDLDKCKVLHIELNNNQHFDYSLRNCKLTKSVQEKYLVVLTSDTLLWNDQIKSCISKANQMLCWITRNLISR